MSDIPKIERIIRFCIIREMHNIDERKGARFYEKNRPRTPSSDSDMPRVVDDEKKSSLYNMSHSPSPSPKKRGETGSPQHKRMGSSALMRSIGNSSEAKAPQNIGGSTLNLVKIQTGAAPTKSNLKALDANASGEPSRSESKR